jgi:FKBP-type peptidyl-prolyl cis-trans isomerase
VKSSLTHGFGLLLVCLSFNSVGATGATNSVPAPAFTESQIIETWGWMIAQDKGVAGIEISQAELATFLSGFAANLRNDPLPCDMRENFPNLQRLIKARREKVVRATIRANEAEAKAFFARLKKNTNVFELPNGLCCEILKPGTGPCPRPTQSVNVHYFGHLLNGTEFAEFGPLDMILVTNHTVCRGWVDALQKFNAGTRARLYVPPPLSEREAEGLGVEPGSALVFTLELFAVKDTPAQDLADALVPLPPGSELPYVEGVTDRQLIEAWGWSVAQQTRAAQFGLGASEIATLMKGLTAGIKAQLAPYDLQKINPEVEKFVNDHRERVRAAARQQRLAEMHTLFAGLKQNTNVVELPSGLRYEIVRPGKGPYPKPGQMVIVDYTGRLVDGTVFDRTDNEPLHIEIGLAIRGLNEGLQKINQGGRIKLYLPPDLGFGDMAASGGVTGIPAYSTLIYEIGLLDIEAPAPAGPEKK